MKETNTKDKPITLWEINTSLEKLAIDANIIYQTTNAITCVVAEGNIDASNLDWALTGIVNNQRLLLEDLQSLADKSFQIFQEVYGIIEER